MEKFKLKLFVEIDMIDEAEPNVDEIIEELSDTILDSNIKFDHVKICDYDKSR